MKFAFLSQKSSGFHRVRRHHDEKSEGHNSKDSAKQEFSDRFLESRCGYPQSGSPRLSRSLLISSASRKPSGMHPLN